MRVHLNRALSKLGVLSRSQATAAILDGRVTVDGRVMRDPGQSIDPARAAIMLDGTPVGEAPWRTIVFNKPRGVVTTRRDPESRRTIYDVLGDASVGLVAVGRLDLATSGLLLLTTDTALAHWITDPANEVPRIYLATVRGRVTSDAVTHMEQGLSDRAGAIRAARVTVRKASGRESHLVIELREGRNREVRRLLAAVGHETTRLSRVQLGGLSLGDLSPGAWRTLTRADIHRAFPAFKV